VLRNLNGKFYWFHIHMNQTTMNMIGIIKCAYGYGCYFILSYIYACMHININKSIMTLGTLHQHYNQDMTNHRCLEIKRYPSNNFFHVSNLTAIHNIIVFLPQTKNLIYNNAHSNSLHSCSSQLEILWLQPVKWWRRYNIYSRCHSLNLSTQLFDQLFFLIHNVYCYMNVYLNIR